MVDGGEMPPTFLTLFRKAEFELFQKLEVELSQVLHTEQEFMIDTPVEAGDRLVFTTRLDRALEKRSAAGHMLFLTFDTDFRAIRGSDELPVGSATTRVVIRGAA